jgi:hypothetical protein
MHALHHLGLAGVPKILLTATLLPNHEQVLADWLGIPPEGRTLVLRSPTARANHSIQVAPVNCASQDIFDVGLQLVTMLLRSWEREHLVRGIVFVKTVRDMEMFRSSANFPLCCYHGRMSDEDKERQLHMWLSDPGPKWIVATTALLHGVDYPRVDAVIFLGSPYGLYDFVQGAGRAGRSGQKSLIAIIHPSSGFWKRGEGNKYSCQEGVERMLKSPTCRRASVSEFMDDHITTCATLPGSEPCDICAGGLHPIVQQAILTSMPAKTCTIPPSSPGHHPSPVAPALTPSQNFHPREPPVISASALFNGKAAQVSYKSRHEHARDIKDLISKVSGCFTCRIVHPKHQACHDQCAKSGATSCAVFNHLPFSCTSLPHKIGWIEFRRSLPWKKDVFRCYFCGLPSSVTSTGEHKHNVPNGNKCLYCDSTLAAAWHVLKTPDLLEAVKCDLGFNPDPNADLERSFSEWLVSYGPATEDIRLLAVFSWLCKRFNITHSN